MPCRDDVSEVAQSPLLTSNNPPTSFFLVLEAVTLVFVLLFHQLAMALVLGCLGLESKVVVAVTTPILLLGVLGVGLEGRVLGVGLEGIGVVPLREGLLASVVLLEAHRVVPLPEVRRALGLVLELLLLVLSASPQRPCILLPLLPLLCSRLQQVGAEADGGACAAGLRGGGGTGRARAGEVRAVLLEAGLRRALGTEGLLSLISGGCLVTLNSCSCGKRLLFFPLLRAMRRFRGVAILLRQAPSRHGGRCILCVGGRRAFASLSGLQSAPWMDFMRLVSGSSADVRHSLGLL
mmetsp:Transcript_57277/g.114810  ORF Transcript_57277/g.114810 Transcript_57277/m.114810 type:complete len:293 (+) Transcript_57277:195-1073(+)